MKRLGYGSVLFVTAGIAFTPRAAAAQVFGGYPVTLTGTAAVNAGRLDLINNVYHNSGGAFTTTALNLNAATPWTSTFVGFTTGTGISTSYTYIDNWQFAATPSSVTPEPATMTLLASGLVGLAGIGMRSGRRRRA